MANISKEGYRKELSELKKQYAELEKSLCPRFDSWWHHSLPPKARRSSIHEDASLHFFLRDGKLSNKRTFRRIREYIAIISNNFPKFANSLCHNGNVAIDE